MWKVQRRLTNIENQILSGRVSFNIRGPNIESPLLVPLSVQIRIGWADLRLSQRD
jgi:hypothetical protein